MRVKSERYTQFDIRVKHSDVPFNIRRITGTRLVTVGNAEEVRLKLLSLPRYHTCLAVSSECPSIAD